MNDEKFIPKTYAGQLEPNYYCRGWNEKRKKYCKRRAGAGTNHVGSGRCKHHFGNNDNADKIKHGLYAYKSKDLQERIKWQHENRENPTDIIPDIHEARALLTKFLDEYEEVTEALLAWHASEGQEYLQARAEWVAEVNEAIEPHAFRLDAFVARIAYEINAELKELPTLVNQKAFALDSVLTNMVDRLYAELDKLPKSLERTVNEISEELAQFDARKTKATDLSKTVQRIKAELRQFREEADLAQLDIPLRPKAIDYDRKPKKVLEISTGIAHLDRITRMAERAEKMRNDAIAITELQSVTQFMKEITYDHLKLHLGAERAMEILPSLSRAWLENIRLDDVSRRIVKVDKSVKA